MGDVSPYGQSGLVVIGVDFRVRLFSDLGFATHLSEVEWLIFSCCVWVSSFKMGVMVVLSV